MIVCSHITQFITCCVGALCLFLVSTYISLWFILYLHLHCSNLGCVCAACGAAKRHGVCILSIERSYYFCFRRITSLTAGEVEPPAAEAASPEGSTTALARRGTETSLLSSSSTAIAADAGGAGAGFRKCWFAAAADCDWRCAATCIASIALFGRSGQSSTPSSPLIAIAAAIVSAPAATVDRDRTSSSLSLPLSLLESESTTSTTSGAAAAAADDFDRCGEALRLFRSRLDLDFDFFDFSFFA